MGFPDLFPLGDVGDVHARAHDVFQAGAGFLQGRFDVPQRLHRLGVGVAHADNLSVRAGRGDARNLDDVSHTHCSRIPDNRLPRRTAGNVLPRHIGLSQELNAICSMPHRERSEPIAAPDNLWRSNAEV